MKIRQPDDKKDLDDEQRVAEQRDRVIKRMLETPPQKHKDVPKRRKPKDDGSGS